MGYLEGTFWSVREVTTFMGVFIAAWPECTDSRGGSEKRYSKSLFRDS